jgi:hypothetical protein
MRGGLNKRKTDTDGIVAGRSPLAVWLRTCEIEQKRKAI